MPMMKQICICTCICTYILQFVVSYFRACCGQPTGLWGREGGASSTPAPTSLYISLQFVISCFRACCGKPTGLWGPEGGAPSTPVCNKRPGEINFTRALLFTPYPCFSHLFSLYIGNSIFSIFVDVRKKICELVLKSVKWLNNHYKSVTDTMIVHTTFVAEFEPSRWPQTLARKQY